MEDVAAASREPPELEFKVMGIARAHDDDSTLDWYWTADFGGTVGKTIPV